MLIMGTNTWKGDPDKDRLIIEALKFAEAVKAQGVAELCDAWIANDQNLLWCTWETEDVEALQAAFDEMNRQSGLESELMPVAKMFPE